MVGSLWPVGDATTCVLMARFYQLWRGDGMEPAQALRRAQQWVRDTSTSVKEAYFPEVAWADGESHEHPTHWAAFLYMGI